MTTTLPEHATDGGATTAGAGPAQGVDEFAERVLTAALGCIDIMSIYLGDRLGWYRSLAAEGPCTPEELAGRTGTSARYAREWLEQQAVTGILVAEGAQDARRYRLPDAAAEVLTDATSLAYMGPMPRLFAATAGALPELLEAYRTGGGVSWERLGADAREAQADLNRPWFGELPRAFAEIADLESVLSRPGARVADVGTGAGWSAIELGKAYPGLQVDGFDIDEPSIELARRNAEEAGVSDRVRFHNADGDGLANHGPFDAAFAFECIHDMARPMDVLAAMRLAVRDGGPVIIMDEAVGETPAPAGDTVERLMYGYSLLCCLPDGLSHQPSVGTGTVMRPGVLRDYARAAGFADLEILPIEDFGFFRFYSLIS
ncbi:methyltransferase domain-containing protein [Microbacterium sp. HD4P20]|uniref:SAM-dependent methyltransferase n=1 Tax=Microbacterium sp. HD4P20 TaxID=2864874 RepID=UPI001C644CE5|nr:class I SAM-dependent methyltransferase [Microbacterium sp. HD4P20]MCP2635985.1 methyltransferase domain-containing protein [Microbacterium sp. HD4P20]